MNPLASIACFCNRRAMTCDDSARRPDTLFYSTVLESAVNRAALPGGTVMTS
jgi:hypothetical protein